MRFNEISELIAGIRESSREHLISNYPALSNARLVVFLVVLFPMTGTRRGKSICIPSRRTKAKQYRINSVTSDANDDEWPGRMIDIGREVEIREEGEGREEEGRNRKCLRESLSEETVGDCAD